MAEDVNVVDPDAGAGYNYDSLYDWEAGEQANIDASGTIAVAKCRCTGGTADTTAVTIDGWTTSAADYIKIWTDPSESYRHNGTLQTGNKYRIVVSNNNALLTKELCVKVIGLAVSVPSTNATNQKAIIFQPDTANWDYTVSHCVCAGHSGSTQSYHSGIAIWVASALAGTFYVYNNIVYNFTSTDVSAFGIQLWSDYSATLNAYVYNNTIVGCRVGIVNNLNYFTVAAKNCGLSGCTTNFSGTITQTTCSTTTPTFENSGAGDLHLAQNDSAWLGYGTNLYDDANLAFQTDIDGQDRGGAAAAWDIGADEYVAAASGSIVPILLNQYRARRN